MTLPQPVSSLVRLIPLRHDRAYAYLKGLLLDGGLEPDDVISTEDVARALNISRAPVTDAMKRLTGDGFITVVPQVGCVVNMPAPQEVEDFYRLFAASEALITGLAAERRTVVEATRLRTHAISLDAQCDVLRSAEQPGSAYRLLNRQRYEAIHEIAASSIAGELVANMWDRSDFYIRVAHGAFLYTKRIQRVHLRICHAVADGDQGAAAKLTQDYLLLVGRQISRELAARTR